MDITARTNSRLDLNGNKCGLLKVQCVLDNLAFAGNIIGETVNHDGEYWVYITDKTKRLEIRHARVLPIMVDFTQLDDKCILSGYTYKLVLSIPEAIYNAVVSQEMHHSETQQQVNTPAMPENHSITGIVYDGKNDEALIGCAIYCNKLGAAATDLDGRYKIDNIKPGSTLTFSYVGYKTLEVTFTGKIPPQYDAKLKPGDGTEKVDYFYDPNDNTEYYDLSGNKLPQRPTKKGTYLKMHNGKLEKFTIE
ncbi:MAG: carboxypeptidase-like regulatory domain-containing protein [Muribaculaceae bacterium]